MSETKLSAMIPVDIKVLERRDDGSGRIRIPILGEHQHFDYSKTAGGGPKDGSISMDMLRQMAANYNITKVPIPIGVTPHVTYVERAGKAPGFLDGVALKGDTLYGDFDLAAALFNEVVNERGWRGFSIEGAPEFATAAQSYEGWVLTGGVFTNRPSAEVHFRMAAEGEDDSASRIVSHIQLQAPEKRAKETEMSDESISLASHEAKMRPIETALKTETEKAGQLALRLEAAQGENTKLSEGKRTADGKVLELSAEVTALKAGAEQDKIRLGHLTKTNDHLKTQVAEAEATALLATEAKMADDIKGVIAAAVASKKIAPAFFDGHQVDPVSWMSTRYVSFDAFKGEVEKLCGVPAVALSSAPVKSGHDPAKVEDSKDEQSDAAKKAIAALEKAGIKQVADFTNVTNADEAKAAFEAAQKDK